MFHKLLKNKKFILATILIAGLFLIFSTKSANACNVFTNGTACIEEFVTYIIQTITYAIFFVLGKAINLISQFLFPVVYLGNQAIGSPLVRTGFKICLQIANLGFVVSIIYVAFATITKFNDYKIKDFLIKLITAAVLINFSFAMAGTVMDISNVVGNYFLSKSIPGDGNLEGFSTQMANAFNLGKLNAVKEGPNEGFTDNLSSLGRSFLNLIFSMGLSIFISIIVLLTFIGIVGMMLARYVSMVILITCMPIIWLCYMSPFPEIKGYFNKWWKMFLKWIYFYPVTAFFLYLALLTATSVTNGASSAVYSQGSAQELNKTILNESGLTGLIDAILKAAMFMAALYLGSQAGGGFMKTTMSWANGAKNKMIGAYRGAAIGTGRGTAGIITRSKWAKNTIEGMATGGESVTGIKGRLLRLATNVVPGSKGLLKTTGETIKKSGVQIGTGYNIGLGITEAQRKQDLKSAQDRLKTIDIDELGKRFESLSSVEKIAAVQRATKDKKLDKIPGLADYFEKNGLEKEWESYDAKKDLSTATKSFGANGNLIKEIKDGTEESLRKATQSFFSGMNPEERKNPPSQLFKNFSEKKPYGGLSRLQFKGLQKIWFEQSYSNPSILRKIMKEFDEDDFKSFQKNYFPGLIRKDPQALYAALQNSKNPKISDNITEFEIIFNDPKLSEDDKKTQLEAVYSKIEETIEKNEDALLDFSNSLINSNKGKGAHGDLFKVLSETMAARVLGLSEEKTPDTTQNTQTPPNNKP